MNRLKCEKIECLRGKLFLSPAPFLRWHLEVKPELMKPAIICMNCCHQWHMYTTYIDLLTWRFVAYLSLLSLDVSKETILTGPLQGYSFCTWEECVEFEWGSSRVSQSYNRHEQPMNVECLDNSTPLVPYYVSHGLARTLLEHTGALTRTTHSRILLIMIYIWLHVQELSNMA